MTPDALLRLAEEEASCEVFGLLKRPDEKWVTERAYDNPKFVEDLVRDIALRLKREPRIAEWTVKSENFESIHNHSAYAEISGSNGENGMMNAKRKRIAVVGSGISGLSAAWLLAQRHAVTLYEAAPRLGGHTNTVDVTLDGVTHPVDTGFLVFNHKTYPNLTALFDHLGVDSVESEMSFAVSLENAATSSGPAPAWPRCSGRSATWCGRNSGACWPTSCASTARAWNGCCATPTTACTLRAFLDAGGYSRAFADWYLLPMAAAIWSCPPGRMLDYPLATFVRFCHNHGLLQVFDRPLWRTVQGGGREYVNKLAAASRTSASPRRCSAFPRRRAACCWRTTASVEEFDQVVLACHSDQALAILDETASAGRAAVLAPSATSPTTPCCTPTPRCCRASAACGRPGTTCRREARRGGPVSVSYLINRLQPLPFRQPVVVTLNPQRAPAQDEDASPRSPTRIRSSTARPSPPSANCPPSRGATASGSAAPGAATASTRTACAPGSPWPAPSAAARPGTASWARRHELGEDPVRFGDAPPAAAGAAPLRLSGVRPAAAARPAGPGGCAVFLGEPAQPVLLPLRRPRRARRLAPAALDPRPAGARGRRRRRRGLAAVLPAHAGLRLQPGQLLVLPRPRRRACAPCWPR
jgi:predicted NAD/FAD-binding protein